MTLQTPSRAAPTSTGVMPISATVLESLAARFRPAGLYLMLLRPDGTIAFSDPAASLFFQRYALPVVQYGDASDPVTLKDRIRSLGADSPTTWSTLPGVCVAAFPYLERRITTAVIVLAAKSESFKLDEDMLRVCSQLGLDGIWLCQEAEGLATFDEKSLASQMRLAVSMLKDQVRLAGFQNELDSLSSQLATTYEELSLIYQVSSGMRINRRANEFFQQACLDVLEVMGVGGMGVALSGDCSGKSDPVLYGPLSLPPGTVHRLASEIVPILCHRKGPLLVNDLSKDKTFNWLAEHARKLIAVPLQRQDEVLGCMFGLDKRSGDFDSQDSKLLNSIANESAIYLENAMLFDDVHGLMMGLLHSLTSAVDAKDAYTCGHSERVAILARQLAVESGQTEALADRIYMAGLLHDVGKIGVPESVLQKPGRLTAEEFEQMKKHPQIGARILRDIKQIRDIIPGVLHHHERYDGNGYPANLSGENIPLMGRILCLADCFDAMTSNRTYRKALPLEVAMTEIRRCSGTQFDPQLTESFLKISADRFRELLRPPEQAQRLLDAQGQPLVAQPAVCQAVRAEAAPSAHVASLSGGTAPTVARGEEHVPAATQAATRAAR